MVIQNHPYKILISGGSGHRKANTLLNFINTQLDIDIKHLYVKDLYEEKYQFLNDKRESTGLKNFNDPKAFTECSNDSQDVYKNIEEYNIGKSVKY